MQIAVGCSILDTGCLRLAMFLQETLGASKNIRAIKTKQNELRHQGMPSTKAGRIAASHITGKSASKKDKKDKTAAAKGAADDKAAPPSKVYAGGKKSGRFKPPNGLTQQEKNKVKRHGKGARSFKSKAKHKRR